MEFYLRKVVISNLFEEGNNYVINLAEGCNCIYGANGTGKTTIINLIVNSLNADIDRLYKSIFSSISIFVAKSSQKRAVKLLTISKSISKDGNTINICVEINSTTKHSIEIKSNSEASRVREQIALLKNEINQKINQKINLTHVPLLRMHDSDLISHRIEGDNFLHTLLINKNLPTSQIHDIIDPSARVLSNLQKNFTNEANIARKTITQKLELLKSKIIEKVMIDDSLVQMSEKATSKAIKAINNVTEAFDISAYVDQLKEARINVPEDKIREHFSIWQKQNENVRDAYKAMNNLRLESNKNNKPDLSKKYTEATQKFNRSYFALIAMTNFNDRFLSIVKDVESMQSEKQELTKVFSDYEKEVNIYFDSKKRFSINDDGQFSINAKGREVQPTDLSSGEKHILALLGRAALSRKEGAVFVADEPELSLHLDWQRMILPSIIKLSPKSQIIVATHSPAINAKDAHSIDLEECR